MSSFNGQMKEYTRIAIDRFDGKNLQCTAFFLSHCHKDHMVGLNSPSFVDCLLKRDGVFLYCSEITRLLLLAEKDYSQLTEHISVLEIGVSQTIRVPTNSTSGDDHYVSVTAISAGHCPGSVMFLFEGHEGACLYTGDFRWEINHAAGVTFFKEDNRVKEIQSLYVDTTFCIPEAYHIPKRSECVEAAMVVISDWLQRSPFNIVFISCPARYGHENLLMELSRQLNVKIHVPEWKVHIYDQIPELKSVFTSDPSQARIHACSGQVGRLTCLPPSTSARNGKQLNVLRLRPSTMWFTSNKRNSTTQDLIVKPVSERGLYRICYSMHSSYSEIRDLVSYLQPKHAYPNVRPVSDAGIDVVQARLNNFQKHLNKARVVPPVVETHFPPLGTLRKLVVDPASTQQPSCIQDAESSDELVFSSQETSSKGEVLTSGNKSSSRAPLKESCNKTADESPSPEPVSTNSTSQSNSSYKGSATNNEELDLFSDNGRDNKTARIRNVQTRKVDSGNEKLESSLSLSSGSVPRLPLHGECRRLEDFAGNCCNKPGVRQTPVNTNTGNRAQRFSHASINGTSESSLHSDVCTTSQVNGHSDVCTTSQVNGQRDVCTTSQVNGHSDVCTTSQVNGQRDVRTTSQVNGHSDVCTTSQVNGHSDVCTTSQVNGHSDVCTTSQVNGHSDVCTTSQVNGQRDVRTTSQVNGHSDVCTTSQVNGHIDDNEDIVFSSQVLSDETFSGVKATLPNTSSTTCNIVARDNTSTIEGVINTSDSPSTECKHGDGKQVITVVSSSQDSQNTLEQESQALWSVSYSLENFIISDSLVEGAGSTLSSLNVAAKSGRNCKQGQEQSQCVSVQGTGCGEGLSLQPVLGNTLCVPTQLPASQHSSQRKQTQVTNNSALKRRLSRSFNAVNVKQLKRASTGNKSNMFIEKSSHNKDKNVLFSDRVSKKSHCSVKRFTDSKCTTISNCIDLVNDCNQCRANISYIDVDSALPSLTHCTHGYKLQSFSKVSSTHSGSTHGYKLQSFSKVSSTHSGSTHGYKLQSFSKVSSTQSGSTHAPREAELIDLTLEAPDDVVDLTVETSQ